MIEQLISSQGVQDAFISDALKQQPNAANGNDVMRFNMEMSDKKPNTSTQSHLLQDVKIDPARIENNLLSMNDSAKNATVSNPLSRLDGTYRAIMGQIDKVPQFDKFLEMREKDKAPAVRTNVLETKEISPAEEVKNMLDELRHVRTTAGAFSKDISKWHITTQIWSANIKILTTVVSQASQGFKTLFRSAG